MRLPRVADRPLGWPQWRRFILGLLLLLGGLALVWRWQGPKGERIPTRATESGLAFSLPRVGGPTGYVASASCRECHPRQYDSWRRSYHRTMTQLMTTNNVLADFNHVSLEFMGERFILNRQSNNFFSATIVDLDDLASSPGGRTSPVTAIKIPMGLVTGSHHMQVFWLPAGAGNTQIGFPFTWLIDDRRWVPRNDAFIRDPASVPVKEVWNFTCIRCHATAGQPRPDAAQGIMDTRVAELGIACEACHGPGLNHVNYEAAAKHSPRDSQKAKTEEPGLPAASVKIVQPRDLDHVRSSQVCGACHSIKWFDDSEGWKEHGFRFRPGDDLEQTTPIVRPKNLQAQPWLQNVLAKHPDLLEDFFWPDGMIRVAGREYNGLIESPCFQKGDLSCLSCHSMHQSDPDHQMGRGKEGNQACLQCHEKFAGDVKAHTHHAAESSGSLCYNCHMPHTTYGLLKGIRSHQIASPNVQTTLATGRPNGCSLCHLDQSLGWTSRYLKEWYGQAEPTLSEEERKVSAGILWLQKGDAGQRALAAWSSGWSPALEASGRFWQASQLSLLLEDSYSAVRYIAGRALERLPGFAGLNYDFVGTPQLRHEVKERVLARSKQAAKPVSQETAGRLLLRPDGTLDEPAAALLQAQRNNRSMRLRE